MALYKGFSSYEYSKTGTFSVTDINLVKIDLLNHIFTRKGERVMMAQFGTLIPELVFEPLDDFLIEQLEDELEVVFDYDPRVERMQLEVIPDYDRNSVMVAAKLLFIELNMVDTLELNIQFERG